MCAAKLAKVSMTPRQNGNVKTIRVERIEDSDTTNTYLEGKGKNSGIIINKEDNFPKFSESKAEMQLEFTCIMHSISTNDTYAENRCLKFWFVDGLQQFDRLDSSYDFFKELTNPRDFPKDYPGFITKVIKQLQLDRFSRLKRVDVDFVTLNKQEQEALVPRVAQKSAEVVIRENVQARLDDAFPNCLSMEDLVRILETKEGMIHVQVQELMANDVIEQVEIEGKRMGYRRKICYHNEDVKVVKETDQMQRIFKKEKPTVAVITNLLCEKMAVDAMMTDKTTFVKFEGESHIYTIGMIGSNKVISTKVAMVGRELKARISSANTTTRLLGTFQDVKHVFIVGVGGGVPRMYEFDKHSRRGDIVVSYPSDHRPVYIFCEKVNVPDEFAKPGTPTTFDLKEFTVRDNTIQNVIDRVLDDFVSDPPACEWNKYMQAALHHLQVGDISYIRPSADTDKLELKIAEGVTFDIRHPEVPTDLKSFYPPNIPAVRLGFIGSGRPVSRNDTLRDLFSKEHSILAYDAEYDQVLDSVMGNGLRSFALIRGIADYVDGSNEILWQPYASLSAAAFMKSVILRLRD